jgi:hypothetical protein
MDPFGESTGLRLESRVWLTGLIIAALSLNCSGGGLARWSPGPTEAWDRVAAQMEL